MADRERRFEKPARISYSRKKDAIKQITDEYGRIDVLINNAQASKSGLKLVEHTKEDFLNDQDHYQNIQLLGDGYVEN